jgi:hypothetical protein
MGPPRNPPATLKPNPRQARYARLIVEGMDQSDAWRVAYEHPTGNRRTAIEQASRIAAYPAVIGEIARLRGLKDVKTVLSLNDRLEILARDAQLPGTSAPMAAARARSIQVYNDTAGDHAPDRQEITHKGDPANPVAVTQVPLSKADKIAALRAQRPKKVTP